MVAVGAGVALYFEIIGPYFSLKRSLNRLANRDFSRLPLSAPPFLFREMSRDVRKISDLLQQLDRQITDEGFSLKAILSSMEEGVLITDRSMRIRLVNDALLRLLGLKTSPLNRPVIEIFRKHELQHALESALDRGLPKEIEIALEVPTPSGGYRMRHLDVHVGGLNPKPHARPMAALVVFHDVTAIRQMESKQREFLANVSHEFRTPLAILNGYLETLMDGALADPEMTQRSLLAMHKNTRRLALLIDDLLAISHIEERARLLEFRQANLREVLGHVLEHLEPTIRQHGAEIIVDWAPDAETAEADARRLEQVFSNLLGNALRYGDVEKLVVRITARRVEGEIITSFADNGPGIPLGDQAHIFERFYRVHKDRSRDAGGTGLGLSIVKSVVEAHGGRVSVESQPGQGATFHVRIPLTQGAGPGS